MLREVGVSFGKERSGSSSFSQILYSLWTDWLGSSFSHFLNIHIGLFPRLI